MSTPDCYGNSTSHTLSLPQSIGLAVSNTSVPIATPKPLHPCCQHTGYGCIPTASPLWLALTADGMSRGAGDGRATEGDAVGLQGLVGEGLVGERAGRFPSSKPTTAQAGSFTGTLSCRANL